jgi:hypothetical protein
VGLRVHHHPDLAIALVLPLNFGAAFIEDPAVDDEVPLSVAVAHP